MLRSSFKLDSFEIVDKQEVLPETSLFTLKGRLDFRPGQFVIVEDDHFGEAAYAPCSDPSNKKAFQICVRSCGSTSHSIFDQLPGEKAKLRGPYGNGWPLEKLRGKDVYLIAGGMGLVPLRPMIIQFLKRHFANSLTLYVGFRSSDHLLFGDELVNWRKKFKVEATAEYLCKDSWCKKGLITEAIEEGHFKKEKSVFLLCGPEVMIAPILQILEKKGIEKNSIYISYERRMECGIGVCQHCNIGKYLVCKDGPVFRLDEIEGELGK